MSPFTAPSSRVPLAGDGAGRRVVVALATLAAAVAATLATPVRLDAHARLERSVPAAGARLDAPPREVILWFSEAIERSFTRVQLIGPRGDTIALGAPAEEGSDARAVRVPITGALVNGRYEVRWRVTARDGHPSEGAFRFEEVGVAHDTLAGAGSTAAASVPSGDSSATGAAAAPSAAVRLETPTQVAVRWAEYVALFLVLGAGLFRALIAPRLTVVRPGLDGVARASFARAGAVAVIAALVLVASAVARLAAEAVAVGTSPGLGGIGDLLFGTTWGWAWLAQVAGALVLAVVYPRVRAMTARGSPIALIATLAVVTGTASAGHAVGGGVPMLMVILDAAHLLGAAGWLGVLALVLIAGIPAALASEGEAGADAAVAAVVNAFSPVALWCAAVAASSGVIMAWVHLGSIEALWASPYGWALLTKLALLAVAAGTGAYNWRRMRPALGTAAATARLRRSAAGELAAAALVLVATAVLVALPTPAGASPHESASASAGTPR